MLLAFHKPYGVICQFTPDGSANRTLADFSFPAHVYSLGRLDADSEGLLLLSDEAALNEELLHPLNAHSRTYLVQVEGVPDKDDLLRLRRGVRIGDYQTRPCRAEVLHPQPEISARVPPIRTRKTVPDCWIELSLTEGKNRQVRRMTAAIGHPTLRLIRTRIGELSLQELPVGTWRQVTAKERAFIFSQSTADVEKVRRH